MSIPVCSSNLDSGEAVSNTTDEDIHEAVFRYQFRHNESGESNTVAVYCLALHENKDPRNEFIARFKGFSPIVKKVSECEISNRGAKTPDPQGYAIDKQSGKAALIFRIRKIIWKNKNEVEVQGGYFSYSLSAESSIYYLKKIEGKWIVRKRKLLTVS